MARIAISFDDPALQAACAYPVTGSLKVKTHTRKVRQARRHVIDLLLSTHYGECYSCKRNNNCELQALAKEYGVDYYRFGHVTQSRYPKDESSYSVVRDMDKCILCRRCVRTCIDVQEVGVLEAVGRSDKTRISTYLDKPLGDVVCINCGQCINRCPTGALHVGNARSFLLTWLHARASGLSSGWPTSSHNRSPTVRTGRWTSRRRRRRCTSRTVGRSGVLRRRRPNRRSTVSCREVHLKT